MPDNVAPADWAVPTVYTAADAMPTRSRFYSVGPSNDPDRAIGGYTTASGNPLVDQLNAGDNLYALVLQNTTGQTLDAFELSYRGEQWQSNFNPDNQDALVFSYLITDTFDPQLSIPTQNTYAPYTLDSRLDFLAPDQAQAPNFPLNGNDPINAADLTANFSVAWGADEYLILRWLDNDIAGEDMGLALDDVAFSATGAAVGGLAGDFNATGDVEQGDLDLVLGNWGGARGFEDNVTTFTSGAVDQEELDVVLGNWGSSTAPSFQGLAVPEPGTLAVGVAALGLLARRRRG